MKLPPPPSLVHICRFFNSLCEDTVKFIVGVGSVILVFGGFTFALTKTIGYLVFHLGNDPLKMATETNPIMKTGAGIISIALFCAVPIIVLWLIGSTLRDLWNKSGRETNGDTN